MRQRTDKEDEALGRRRGEAGRHGGHAVDDGGLEVDVEYAQHVDGVERDTEDDQPPLAPPRGGGRRVRLRAGAAGHCVAGTGRGAQVVRWIWDWTGGDGRSGKQLDCHD